MARNYNNDDLDDLFDGLDDDSFLEEDILLDDPLTSDDSPRKGKKSKAKKARKSKRRSVAPKIISLLLVVGLGAGGYYAYDQGMLDDYITQAKDKIGDVKKDSGNKDSDENNLRETEKTKDVDLQLVNTEQVLWTEQMCDTVARWGSNPLEDLPLPPVDEGFNAVQAKEAVKENLQKNSRELRKRADDVTITVKDSYEEAKDFEKDTILTDNNKKINKSPDSHVVSASSAISVGLNDYADSLDSMVEEIDSHATYDFYGHRDTIAMIQNAIPGMNNELSKLLASEINNDLYDNPVTMERVAKLDACAGTVIDETQLNKKFGDVLEEQENARQFVNYRRCESFIDGQERFGGSTELQDSVDVCKKVLSSIVIDNHPASKWNITVDSEKKALPQSISLDEMKKMDGNEVEETEAEETTDSRESDGDATTSKEGDDDNSPVTDEAEDEASNDSVDSDKK